jgi:hypothetical protein
VTGASSHVHGGIQTLSATPSDIPVSISRAFAPLSAYLKLQISRRRDFQDLVSRIVQLVDPSCPLQARSDYGTHPTCCSRALCGNTRRLALCYRTTAAYGFIPPHHFHRQWCTRDPMLQEGSSSPDRRRSVLERSAIIAPGVSRRVLFSPRSIHSCIMNAGPSLSNYRPAAVHARAFFGQSLRGSFGLHQSKTVESQRLRYTFEPLLNVKAYFRSQTSISSAMCKGVKGFQV